MSNVWMTRYAVVIRGDFKCLIGYLIPLNGVQISREIQRICDKHKEAYGDVKMVRRYE